MSNFKGTLKKGLKVGAETHFEFEMRPAFARDLFEAEAEVGAGHLNATDGAMMARQLVRVGSYEGPFTIAMIGGLSIDDFVVLRQAQVEVEKLEKFEPAPPSP